MRGLAATDELEQLLARIGRLTEPELDTLAGAGSTAEPLLERAAAEARANGETAWPVTQIQVAVRFAGTCARFEPAFDPRDEWSMSRRSVLALRACWMYAFALLAADRLAPETLQGLAAPWSALAEARAET